MSSTPAVLDDATPARRPGRPLPSPFADTASRPGAMRAQRALREQARTLVGDAPGTGRSQRLASIEHVTTRLLERLRLAVVHGGDKTLDGAVINIAHSARSWKSYEAVARDIAAAMTRVGCRDVTLVPDDMRLGQRLKIERTHMVWLNTGGVQGRSSMAHGAALLEMLGLPYVGHDPLTTALLDDKLFFKRQLLALGIPTAPFIDWHPGRCSSDPAECAHFARVFRGWDNGFIVKPVSGRASLHVHYVETAGEIAGAARHVFETTRDSSCSRPIQSPISRHPTLRRPTSFASASSATAWTTTISCCRSLQTGSERCSRSRAARHSAFCD
jgi:hypothetical protein